MDDFYVLEFQAKCCPIVGQNNPHNKNIRRLSVIINYRSENDTNQPTITKWLTTSSYSQHLGQGTRVGASFTSCKRANVEAKDTIKWCNNALGISELRNHEEVFIIPILKEQDGIYLIS